MKNWLRSTWMSWSERLPVAAVERLRAADCRQTQNSCQQLHRSIHLVAAPKLQYLICFKFPVPCRLNEQTIEANDATNFQLAIYVQPLALSD